MKIHRKFTIEEKFSVEEKEIISILKKENSIRVFDGRYSNGFVDDNLLRKMKKEGKIIFKKIQGFDFAFLK